MKSILLSIQPKWVAKILNGNKTIDVRKKFPEKYKGWVYIYCTKERNQYLYKDYDCDENDNDIAVVINDKLYYDDKPCYCNGKVVARFYCDKVDKWDIWQEDLDEKLKLACLSIKDFDDYSRGQVAYAIHISQLEIFEKPKELSEFKRCTEKTCIYGKCHKYMHCLKSLTKAPQNYQWIEV